MSVSVLHGLVGLLAWAQVTRGQDIITDDTVFYGQSPPVYPSPNGTGSGPWAESYSKARAFVGQLTLEEKVRFASWFFFCRVPKKKKKKKKKKKEKKRKKESDKLTLCGGHRST
jgi:hypothetical protein